MAGESRPRSSSRSSHQPPPPPDRRNASAVLDAIEPRTGRTPRQEIYRTHKARLYRYCGAPTHRTPLLFVPNLGISRPWVFDLLPGSSFTEYVIHEGLDFYLLDWGVFGPEDDRRTFDDYVAGILPRACARVLESSAAHQLSIIGYCMGTALTLALAASRPELPVNAFVDMAGPVDFSKAGLLTAWLDPTCFDVDRVVDALGAIPPALIWLGSAMLRPTMGLSAMVDVVASGGDARRIAELRAFAKWVREFVGIPGEFFRQWVRDFYQENRLYRGELAVAGRPARLDRITCPVLAVAAADDPVAPPASVRALLDVVSSDDKGWLEVAGSHLSLVVGPEASQRLWPQIARWLVARDQERGSAAP